MKRSNNGQGGQKTMTKKDRGLEQGLHWGKSGDLEVPAQFPRRLLVLSLSLK